MPLTFVHAADLHLDSPLQGLLANLDPSPAVKRLLSDATFDAFDALVNLCIQREVSFLLVSGDVYDCEDRSLRAQLHFRDGLARLAENGIRSFVVHGNHDPLDSASNSISWPETAHVFGWEEVETVPVPGPDGTPLATVTGISYRTRRESRKLQKHFSCPAGAGYHIAMLHCDVGHDTGHEPYVPTSLDELLGTGFDYWALGHVHERRILHEVPWVVYPGNTQGRSVRETGPRGCTVVTVNDRGAATVEAVPLAPVCWEKLEIDVGAFDTFDAISAGLVEAIGQASVRARSALVCRLDLVGRSGLFHDLQKLDVRTDLLQRLRDATTTTAPPFVCIESLRSHCQPEADLDACRESQDLLGEVLRIADAAGSDDALRAQLSAALAPLYEHTRARRALQPLNDEDLDRLLGEAALLCYDLLAEEGQ